MGKSEMISFLITNSKGREVGDRDCTRGKEQQSVRRAPKGEGWS